MKTHMTSIVERLRSTASEREQASARDEEKYLMIVAKLSRQDAVLMRQSADEIERLETELYHKRFLTGRLGEK